jgi:hypothetical protein
MPSQLPIPSLGEWVGTFHRGVKGKRDKREDGHSGAAYDYIAGTTAMLMAREAHYIRDLFRAGYFDQAEGEDLTELVAQRYKIQRILDAPGPGTATLRRASAAADTGLPQTFRTIWKGTRILVSSPGGSSAAYAVAEDTPVAAGALYVAGLPIEATKTGLGSAVDTSTSGQVATFDDPLWDPSWAVTNVRCDDGTVFEKAPAFRARVLGTLQANRPGYATGIVNACVDIGAANVAVFGTNFGGLDLHSCATFVGDPGFMGSPALVKAAKVQLEAWRMLGAEMHIGAMALASLSVGATVQLYDDPGKFDTNTITSAVTSAIRRVLGATGAYGYDTDEFFGAAVGVSDAIQDVSFTSPTSNATLLVRYPPPNGVLWFPQVLTRYQIPANGVSLTFVGPGG